MTAPASATLPPILEIEELHALLREGAPLRLLDVRWALDGSKGHHTYLTGHLPGAVHIDLDTELAGPASPQAGRHPLPDPEDFAASLRLAGIDDDTRVVAYDDTDGAPAGRLVWMLRALGQDAAVLNGGLAAWSGALETDDVRPAAGTATARHWPATAIATIDEAATTSGVLVDARAPQRYRGEVEPIDPRAGHIPGALNLPYTGNLDADGRFLPPEQLRERFAAAGLAPDSEVIAYCGSGVTGTHDVLALQHAGFSNVRLFPGSWSQWSADPQRPVATGSEPGSRG